MQRFGKKIALWQANNTETYWQKCCYQKQVIPQYNVKTFLGKEMFFFKKSLIGLADINTDKCAWLVMAFTE